jgi:hypothetical protein
LSAYSQFFLNSKASVVRLECLEISHSKFSQTYYCVRNATRGVTVTHEDSSDYDYVYVPMTAKLTGPTDDLDNSIQVTLGDLGTIVPQEMDLVRAGDGFQEMPVVKYRQYRSDELDAPLFGPLVLEVKRFSFKPEGAMFEARAPQLNSNKTGERYAIARFPMLKGLL